jgi:hypothetical protein
MACQILAMHHSGGGEQITLQVLPLSIVLLLVLLLPPLC